MSGERDYWLEAYQIMAGTTMLLPTKAHLEALRDAHVRDLAALQDTLKQIKEDFHVAL